MGSLPLPREGMKRKSEGEGEEPAEEVGALTSAKHPPAGPVQEVPPLSAVPTKEGNIGQSNILSEMRYISGSRLMV